MQETPTTTTDCSRFTTEDWRTIHTSDLYKKELAKRQGAPVINESPHLQRLIAEGIDEHIMTIHQRQVMRTQKSRPQRIVSDNYTRILSHDWLERLTHAVQKLQTEEPDSYSHLIPLLFASFKNQYHGVKGGPDTMALEPEHLAYIAYGGVIASAVKCYQQLPMGQDLEGLKSCNLICIGETPDGKHLLS